MVNLYRDSDEIKETDIIFDCPNCGKSLAIDFRGAGLTIPCTDCGQYVDVPIPDGMELTDIDSSDEEQEMRILNLRRSLGTAEGRVVDLQARVDQLEASNAELSKGNGLDGARVEAVLERIALVRGHLQSATDELAKLAALAEGTPKPS